MNQEVLSLRGRYRPITETLGVKETTVTEGGAGSPLPALPGQGPGQGGPDRAQGFGRPP